MRSPPVPRRRRASFGFFLMVAAGAVGTGSLVPGRVGAQDTRDALSEPTLSPSGGEIAFVARGDIWTVSADGGVAVPLVTHEADEGRPLFSPDGRRLAFVSDRMGDDDIYVVDLSTGAVRRLTYGDGSEELDAWSRDGRWIYFSDGRGDPGGQPDIWRIAAEGGTPVRVAADRYMPEFQASVDGDGRLVLAARGRMAQSQWWRNGHSHIDETELWVVEPGEPPTYRGLPGAEGKNAWPQWLPGGGWVVFMSDRSGTENLWLQNVSGGPPRPLTSFQDGRLLFPHVAADGSSVVFERDFGVWRMRLPDGTPEPVRITLRGATPTPLPEHETLSSGFGSLALSPDGKKVAFVARGDVYAADAEYGGTAVRVTRSPGLESEVVWAPDSRRIAYTVETDDGVEIRVHDFSTGREETVVGEGVAATPRFSPDGGRLAYLRDGTMLRLLNLVSGDDRLLVEGQFSTYPFTAGEGLKWSPDGRWIAFFNGDGRMFTNVWAVPAEGGDARPVSGLANAFAGTLVWAPDGSTLYFDTQHRTRPGRIARVDLVPRVPPFREDRFDALFTPDSAEAARTSGGAADPEDGGDEVTRIDFDGIRRRLTLLPVDVDVDAVALSPDGKTLVFTASAEGRQNLYTYSVDPEPSEPPVTRQLTSTAGSKSVPRFTPDGKEVYFLEGGRIRVANVETGSTRALPVSAEYETTFDTQKMAVYRQGWSYLRDHFYDEAYHGADWEAVARRFEPYLRGAATRPSFSRLMNLMVGELNASHLGHRIPGRSGPGTGALGVRLNAREAEAGRFRLDHVVGLGPADVAGLEVGDYLLDVDGVALTAATNLDSLLEGRVGERVALRVASDPNGSDDRRVHVKPASVGQIRSLAYRDWVEANRAYVDSVSGGRLGYVHMAAMGSGNLDRLIVDLDAENHAREGVVVDLRSNNGGFVNAYALDVFARRGYITMQSRGYPEVPARSMLGQRALERGTVLVVDRNTLSDGEDFTEGYRALGLGPVVGEPTAGWIVYTWNWRLVDGSTLRLPRTRIRGAAGDDMERNPRPVDIPVQRSPGGSYSGGDAQLDAAVRALLGGGS